MCGMRMDRPVLNPSDVTSMVMEPDGGSARFGARISPVGDALPSERLGVMHVSVEPGKRAFPYHNHLGAEEMFVILSGSGTYRFGGKEYPIKAGDICAARVVARRRPTRSSTRAM